ncbi:MAG: ABC transporter permease [Lachnospiraceae bacterium]|nr:ABC transporter permease [Lachnospiraceae bacterium]
MAILIGILEQGLSYGIMALGAYITYKILDFPDLTVDGSFPLGAAVTAVLLGAGVNPFLTLLIAFAAGVLAGICTGLIHVKLKVRDLLSGIIMFTALYTINLKIPGKAYVPLFTETTIFDGGFLQALGSFGCVVMTLLVALVAKILLDLYLKTKSGYLLRAVGDNDVIVTALAKDQGLVKIVGLAIANGLVALGGSVYCQQQRYYDISMGTGTVVIGLASVIIGTNLFKNMTFMKATSAVLIGSILYKACVAGAMALGLDPQNMKLVTAVLFLVILVISMDRKKKVKGNA